MCVIHVWKHLKSLALFYILYVCFWFVHKCALYVHYFFLPSFEVIYPLCLQELWPFSYSRCIYKHNDRSTTKSRYFYIMFLFICLYICQKHGPCTAATFNTDVTVYSDMCVFSHYPLSRCVRISVLKKDKFTVINNKIKIETKRYQNVYVFSQK